MQFISLCERSDRIIFSLLYAFELFCIFFFIMCLKIYVCLKVCLVRQ